MTFTEPATIPSEESLRLLSEAAPHTLVVLRPGANRDMEGADAIVWRNASAIWAGTRKATCRSPFRFKPTPASAESACSSTTRTIMDADPGVAADVFGYEVYETRAIPGSSLPALHDAAGSASPAE
jgi:hypothetical protein